MATDPRHLRPSELCRLLNSTPLGEVIKPSQLQRHRIRAGHHIGTAQHIDLLRYTAWMIQLRHAPKPAQPVPANSVDLFEAALGAAKLACSQEHVHSHKFTLKHEALIAALLTEPTHAQAAAKAGISEATLYRWLALPEFLSAYRTTCRALVGASCGRLHLATVQAVDGLLEVVCHGRRDADRTRASIAVLDFAFTKTDRLQPTADSPARALSTADAVTMLSAQLVQIEQADLPLTEKARLTTMLTDALLRAHQADDLAQRLEALEVVLQSRKEKAP